MKGSVYGVPHRSPGQHKKHYSPHTRVLLVERGYLPDKGRGAYLWVEREARAARTIRMPARPEAYATQLYNRLHELEQRMARWLLMCQDRVDSDVLALTHDFLAQMLGSGRPSVTLACGMLERAGAIENLRGTIRVLNRKDLEDAACECYDVIQHFNGGLGLISYRDDVHTVKAGINYHFNWGAPVVGRY